MSEYLVICYMDGNRVRDKIKIPIKKIKFGTIYNDVVEYLVEEPFGKIVEVPDELYQFIKKYG